MPDGNNAELRDLLGKIMQTKINANRRYIDEILVKIQDQNHQYYLERLGYELREMELAQQKGNLRLVMHHRVLADTYKSILENCFPK
jgi:hypothetical protein